MKKALSLILALAIIGSICLTGCGSSSGDGLKELNSYMLDDDTAVIKFKNETNQTITYVSGNLNLFTGSAASQTPIKTPSFTWSGSCEKGGIFEVTVNISGAPAGLADDVNRIGYYISTIN